MSGRLSTQWRGAVAYFTEESFVDWHFPGPHMCFWRCQFIDRRQVGPFDRLRFWMLGPGLSADDYGGGAYEANMRAMYTLSYWGGLDVPNPTDGEQMFRTCLTYEYVHDVDRDPHLSASPVGDGGDDGVRQEEGPRPGPRRWAP
eukprot:7816257-Pyramimonas_sp.AAC.1